MSEQCPGPTIGLSLSPRAAAGQQREYRGALEKRGARVEILLPQGPQVDIGDLNGLVLSGGGDIHPRCYGQSLRGGVKLKCVSPERDEFELGLTRAALGLGLPVFGICRGAQVLGVALGATLVQDIPAEIGSAVRHSNGAFHSVRLAEDSRLHRILQGREMCVNSFHHQANHSLPEGVCAVAWSEDGVVEAIEVTAAVGQAASLPPPRSAGDGFALGVQWHPERMENDEAQARLLQAFVAAAWEQARAKAPCGRGKAHASGGESA